MAEKNETELLTLVYQFLNIRHADFISYYFKVICTVTSSKDVTIISCLVTCH